MPPLSIAGPSIETQSHASRPVTDQYKHNDVQISSCGVSPLDYDQLRDLRVQQYHLLLDRSSSANSYVTEHGGADGQPQPSALDMSSKYPSAAVAHPLERFQTEEESPCSVASSTTDQHTHARKVFDPFNLPHYFGLVSGRESDKLHLDLHKMDPAYQKHFESIGEIHRSSKKRRRTAKSKEPGSGSQRRKIDEAEAASKSIEISSSEMLTLSAEQFSNLYYGTIFPYLMEILEQQSSEGISIGVCEHGQVKEV